MKLKKLLLNKALISPITAMLALVICISGIHLTINWLAMTMILMVSGGFIYASL